MRRFLGIGVLLVLLMANTGWAEEKDAGGAFTVMVVVMDFAGEPFAKQLQSAIVKDLETVSDIRIVETREIADYAILVLPTPAHTTEDAKAEVGLFILVSSPFRSKDFDSYLDRAKLDLKQHPGLLPFRAYATMLEEVLYLSYQTCSQDSLEKTCKEIVKTFDQNCLAPRRQTRLEFENQAKALMKEALTEEAKKQKAHGTSAP